MIIRTIMIFPEFENIDVINDIRRKYDPLDLAPIITNMLQVMKETLLL